MESLVIPALWALSVLLVLGGIVGTVLPVLPGAPMMFGGLWLAAWLDHYAHAGTFTLLILGALTALSILVDWVSSALGAKRVGASARAVSGAAAGTLVGGFILFPWGLLLGPFIGAFLGELGERRSLEQAAASGMGTLIGLLLGTVMKAALAFLMLGVFALPFLF